MKKTTITTTFLLIFLSAVNSFSALLQEINRVEQAQTIKLYLSFDKLPAYSLDQTGRRIDLILEDTILGPRAKLPHPGENVIRYAPIKSNNNLTLSLGLRYLPEKQAIMVASGKQLILEITTGSLYTKSFKELSRQLDGLSQGKGNNLNYLTPLSTSPYRYNWKSFFSEYQPEIKIKLPVSISWPPFPMVQFLPPMFAENSALLPKNLLNDGKNNKWPGLLLALPGLIEKSTNPLEQRKLALIYGEVLARAGRYEESYRQFYLIQKSYPKTFLATLAHYLLLHVQADNVDKFLADFEIEQVANRIPKSNPLFPYIFINQIELALGADDLAKMNTLLLQDNIGLPADLENAKAVRQADYWHAINQPIKAAAAYNIASWEKVLTKQPYSRNGFCDTLFTQKKYSKGANCYGKLASYSNLKDSLSMVLYRRASCQEKAGRLKNQTARLAFEQVAEAFPNQEGGIRARLRSYDLAITAAKSPETMGKIAGQYLEIAEKEPQRDVSEEAYFKGALAFYLAGENSACLKTLKKMHSSLQFGRLHETGQALLLEAIPKEVQRLASEKKYKQIIIILEQNKESFANGWIDDQVTKELAKAYYALGLYQKAHQVFLYLLTNGPSHNETIYLPLIHSAYYAGAYIRVTDYCRRYQIFYPEGKDYREIRLYMCKALLALGRNVAALQNLPDPLPQSAAAQKIATKVFFYNGLYQKVLDLAKKRTNNFPESLFFQAESLWQLGNRSTAYSLFQQIEKTSMYNGQSLYRQAEFLLQNNQENRARRVLQQLTEDASETSWAKLAQQELVLLNISEMGKE
ncbi:tetratricopeptide repeat protein [Desulfotalea psychrophila]|uniref:Tetratricopeptide repeat protein n=1 Tax=Desulfotalea psychrophila (strain LSv54 / DSM 12343) TaxID=177439 RepID=Q6AJU5_DESPS|nr:tetratricopeptide repeat protein [Desulfotalea psychrophila]CAG37381.1 unknown protein [Desulfotalea psychrophila LSv54]